jgi:hypothetical protein
VLQRLKESKTLYEIQELYLKEKDKLNLKLNVPFQRIIISDNFVVQDQKIFYCISTINYPDGIMDMEKLEKKTTLRVNEKYKLGPFQVDGNDEFLIMIIDYNTFKVTSRIFLQPDSYKISLLADYQNKCEFTTFIKNGEIMLKILDRFMIFDQNGDFIYHVTFKDIDSDTKNQFQRVKEYQQNKKVKVKQF